MCVFPVIKPKADKAAGFMYCCHHCFRFEIEMCSVTKLDEVSSHHSQLKRNGCRKKPTMDLINLLILDKVMNV